MEFLMNHWSLLIAVCALICSGLSLTLAFASSPREEQLEKVRAWLLWAVTNAEKDLGNGTGNLKLRKVYDAFLTKFPWLVKAISFEKFSVMVDDALKEMHDMLQKNEAAAAFVEKND